ncbi:hypothetical protein APSETT445_009252 [Aspergillus pseudonomiae]
MPRNWPTLAKTIVMVDVMLLNFSFYAASAIFTPSIPGIEEAFGATTAEGTLGLSLFVIAYGIGPLIITYMLSLTIALVFDGIYHFTALQQGLAFFGILAGAVVSVIVYMLWLYFSYQPRVARPEAIVEPEARLVPGQVGAICIPVCLFIFAWTSRESVHWIVPIIGTAFFAPGFYLTFQSVLNYLGESYPRYVASVFAGNTFFRSSFGGALPLAAPRMLQSLGIGWASSTLGFISIAMVPLPFILERYGKRLRSWSKYAN